MKLRKQKHKPPVPTPAPRATRQPTMTFEELVAWKARSNDANEQKKIRRLIRELRAATPDTVPELKRGISKDSGIEQPNVSIRAFDPADKATWPTSGYCSQRQCRHTQALHKKTRCKGQVKETVTVKGQRTVIREHECACPEFKPTYPDAAWTDEMHGQFIDWMAQASPMHVKSYVNKDGVPTMGCDATCCATENWARYDGLVSEAQAEERKATKAAKKLRKLAKQAARKINVTKVSSV